MLKRNKKEFFKLNNKGFAITSIIYSMLLLFIILMTLTILTLGRKKVLLDKTKNETLGLFSQLDSYPCMVTEKNAKEIAIGVGDVITCKTENFYVIENDGTNIKMLAKYNLNVGDNKISSDTEGIQSVHTPGFVTGGTTPYPGTISFSSTNYWSSTTTYPSFMYNNNSNLSQYVDEYAVYLRRILETPEIIASLISYDQMIALGCNSTNNSCANAPEWLHLVSYWTGSAYNTTNIWGMNSSGTFGNARYSENNIYGVRPVVAIPINKVKNKTPDVIIEPEPGYTGVKAIVYLDPTDLNKKCTESDVNSDTGTKTGCMKWYAYAEDDTTYTMLLDHNTTSVVAWNSSGDNSGGPVTVNDRLTKDTIGWNSSLNPRLITTNEIDLITMKMEFDSIETSYFASWYYFDSLTSTAPSQRQKPINYGWLIDRTSNNCINYGCLNNSTGDSPSDMEGYWTSSIVSDANNGAWAVINGGNLYGRSVAFTDYFGVRPVITVQKNLLNELD